MDIQDVVREKRDLKAKPHLEQYAPVWMVDEEFIPADEALVFNVVFQHHDYGWVNRRYRYDGFNNVLYYRGQTVLSEDEVLPIQETTPYINATVANIPNSYGG